LSQLHIHLVATFFAGSWQMHKKMFKKYVYIKKKMVINIKLSFKVC